MYGEMEVEKRIRGTQRQNRTESVYIVTEGMKFNKYSFIIA